jgi:hypothetical protein
MHKKNYKRPCFTIATDVETIPFGEYASGCLADFAVSKPLAIGFVRFSENCVQKPYNQHSSEKAAG